jgi:hypothetical protein
MAIVSLRIVDLANCAESALYLEAHAALATRLLEAADEVGNNSRKQRENNPSGSQVVR